MHHMTLPSATPNVWCSMQVTKQTKWYWEQWPQVVWYLLPCHSYEVSWCLCSWRQPSEEWHFGNVITHGLLIMKGLSTKRSSRTLNTCPHARRSDICMVKKAVYMMKSGKAAGTVMGIIRAAGETSAIMICNLAHRNCNVPTDWGQRCIIWSWSSGQRQLSKPQAGQTDYEDTRWPHKWCLFTTPSLEIECVVSPGHIHQCWKWCLCWRGLQPSVWVESRGPSIPSALHHRVVFLVSRDGWAALPRGATGLSAVCDCGISWSYSLTILEALSSELHSGGPWENLYVNDLFIIADWMEECVRMLLILKEAIEEWRRRGWGQMQERQR